MGSAVQRAFLKINDAVLEGGDTLTTFAKLAGMSASEFKTAWQDDAAHALIPFLKGLNDTHEAGGNVNQVLRDLGITSVNELNTLLVLAGGYDQLAGNLKMASDAYNETEESMMALNKEAELAYGTTLGKLRTAWNRLKDSLIDIGEPIADAVLDMVDAAEPLFETIENIATGFSEMDASAQRDIINTVAKIALIAPALKIAGGAMSTLGDIFTVKAGLTRKAGKTITKAMLDSSDEVLAFGGAAQTAAGSKGVGGLIASLAGSAGLPWALGIAAVALGGWTLWKTWGEDAWNAAEQTRKWGTVVGEETNDVLTDVQGLGSQITGEFGLIAQGFDTDSSIIAGNFTEIGETIENSVIERISALDSLIEGLPETVSRTLSEIHEQEKTQSEKSLETIGQNNEEIARIRQVASDNNRELSRVELERIEQMSKESIEAYVAQLPIAKSEQKQILDAMNGDVENATYEQAESWARSLGEQRQQLIKHNEDQKREYLSSLEELGYSDEYVAQAGKMWDDLNENTTLGLDQQLATIAEKYPQIADEILFSNGQIISGNETFVNAAKKSNQELLENAQSLSARLGVTASTAAKNLSWMGDETTIAGKTWNDLVFDEKTGEVKTNAREVVLEGAEDIDTWNKIRPLVHDANLNSNAKLIIGEAAIMHGRWDGMAWEDKQAVLEDNFSLTVYDAIVADGTWDKLTWEERTALLNNGFTDTVIQAMIDDGKWESLEWEERMAILKTNTPETLKQVLKDIGIWETLPIAVRNLLADKTQLDRTVDAAQRKLNSLKDKSVTITTRNRSIYESIYRTKGSPSSANFVHSGGRILHNARGTDFHPGGLAIVNDQKAPTFRELVTLPDGRSFIPEGRDVLLDLPKGSKVLRAALTKMKFPDIKQYQDGVGYSRRETQQIMNGSNVDMSQTNNLLKTLINLISDGQVIQMDGNEVGRTVYPTIDSTMTTNMQRSQVMNMQGG